MSVSAFGVEHGFSKGLKAVLPKYVKAAGPFGAFPKRTDTMARRLRVNVLQGRTDQHQISRHIKAYKGLGDTEAAAQLQRKGQGRKQLMHASIAGHANISRRQPGTGIGRMESAATRAMNPVAKPKPKTTYDDSVFKSFKKLGPNLRVARGMIAQGHFADDVTMGEKLRYHYATQRNIAGRAGKANKKLGAERKDISRRIATTLSGQNRKNRVLP